MASPTPSSKQPMPSMLYHVSLKMAQAVSMLAPPIILVSAAVRRGSGRPFSINRFMRRTTGSVLIGAALGVPIGWARLRNEPEDRMEDRVERLSHNIGQIRTDDYSLIGAALGALISPALFIRRAPLITLVLGGASIGLGVGVETHLIKARMEGYDVRPEGMVGEIPVVGGNDKK